MFTYGFAHKLSRGWLPILVFQHPRQHYSLTKETLLASSSLTMAASCIDIVLGLSMQSLMTLIIIPLMHYELLNYATRHKATIMWLSTSLRHLRRKVLKITKQK